MMRSQGINWLTSTCKQKNDSQTEEKDRDLYSNLLPNYGGDTQE